MSSAKESNPCVSGQLLRRLHDGRLDDAEVDKVAGHLEQCDACKQRLDEIEQERTDVFVQALKNGDADGRDNSDARRRLPDPPFTMGVYQVRRLLDRGGMGQVYEAFHTKLGKRVAIKTVIDDEFADGEYAARFQKEIRTLGALEHANLVAAFDTDTVQDVPFLVMEFVEGLNLVEVLTQRRKISVDEAVDYLRQAARALAYLHGRGVIHRDVKPTNMMLSRDGVVKLIDFGLARSQFRAREGLEGTIPYVPMGTADYMSPEQAENPCAVDERADMYSLGCTAHFLLIGRSFVEGRDSREKMQAHRDTPIPSLRQERPDVPERLDRLFQSMVAKIPRERPGNMAEVVDELGAIADDADLRPATAPSQRRRLVLVTTIAVLLAALGLWARQEFWGAHHEDDTLGDQRLATSSDLVGPLQAQLDLIVTSPTDESRHYVSLWETDKLPVRHDDLIRIQAELSEPLYAYLLWVSSEGTLQPIYPWKRTEEGSSYLPEEQHPVDRITLPEMIDEAHPILGEPGMICLMLFLRRDPLPDSFDLAGLEQGIQPMRLRGDKAVVEFENGQFLSANQPGKRGTFGYDTRKIDDPLSANLRHLDNRLRALSEFRHAIAFSFEGEKNSHP